MKQYTITLNDAELRLDKFLKKLFPNASLSYIYKLLRKGNIKIVTLSQLSGFSLSKRDEATKLKGKKQDREYKLQETEIVQIFLSDTDIADLQKNEIKQQHIKSEEKLSKKDIVFEDDDLLVINKNPGFNVHPGDHKSEEVSLIEQVHDYYQGALSSLTFKPSLIHRIDRDTSGIIMIAKSKKSLTKLSDDFKKHDALKKTYFCIVLGKLSRKSGTITKKLKRIENAKAENKVQISDSGLEAITHYTLLNEYKLKLPLGEQIISTLEVTIETGRMHQIRVHMAALGNPILGDKNYGNKKLNAYFAKYFKITRQMLHAWKIQFTHPILQKKMSLEAKPKKDMMEFINILKK